MHPGIGVDAAAFSRRLLSWYIRHHRDLPWRRTRDPYAIWISEIMLQQTRAETVKAYYQNFLLRFPTLEALAQASEEEVLRAWSGLGYYSRARNLHRAAREMAAAGGMPHDFHSIRKLPGIGDYTAAAISSIAFNQPYAVLDGNVMRVIARVVNDAGDIASPKTRGRFQRLAQQLLPASRPGRFNQAMMELGAVICLPRAPLCSLCPVAAFCRAAHAGTATDLPVRLRRNTATRIEQTLIIVRRRSQVLMWRRAPDAPRMAGFWELPEPRQVPQAKLEAELGVFRHTITNHYYSVRVFSAKAGKAPPPLEWVPRSRLSSIPLSTTARKALAFVEDLL